MEHKENASTSLIPIPAGRSQSSLAEMPASARNTRNADLMPPPENPGRKHYLSDGSREPPAKKKAVAARGGGDLRKRNTAALLGFGKSDSGFKATTNVGSARNSASYSSVSQSNTSNCRNMSNGPFSASAGPAVHAQTLQNLNRSKTTTSQRQGISRTGSVRSTPSTGRYPGTENGPKSSVWNIEQKQEEKLDRLFKEKVLDVERTLGGSIDAYRSRTSDLERSCAQLTETNRTLSTELDTAKNRIMEAGQTRESTLRDHERRMDDLFRQHGIDIEKVKQDAKHDLERLKDDHWEELRGTKRRFEDELSAERSQKHQAVSQLSLQGALDQQKRQLELDARDQELRVARAEHEKNVADLDRERALNDDLRQNLSTATSNATNMETSRQALQAKVEFLESDSKSQSEAYARMEQQMREAIEEAEELREKLRKEETLRRKLHNQVQELKGNIRVFCRVRPALGNDGADEQAKIAFPDDGEDAKAIEVRGPEERSSLGTVTTKKYPFTFDRVFGPSSQNQQIFDEVSQLIQSALDGYNVCIFCYGQTGSGKTYTMSSDDGMIPRAVHMIYETAQGLEERGWKYQMEGSFVEVYNESLNDLLGRPEEFDKKRHEIRHDVQTCKTTVTDMTCVDLDSPQKVEQILARAMSNRSVAATRANQRSSRSHSVFILRLSGQNSITGEKSEGTLNLVDLAGSERLNQSKAEGARLKETQNINRSLSCLGDVIGALGQPGAKDGGGGGPATSMAHIPYRNSKLTYLLQFSLGGNSKTLMFCMISPLEVHLGETLTSLRFATKVHNTHIGPAKKRC